MVFATPSGQFYRDVTTPFHLPGLSHLDNFIVTQKSCSFTGTLQKLMPTPTQTATPHTTGPLAIIQRDFQDVRLPALLLILFILTRKLFSSLQLLSQRSRCALTNTFQLTTSSTMTNFSASLIYLPSHFKKIGLPLLSGFFLCTARLNLANFFIPALALQMFSGLYLLLQLTVICKAVLLLTSSGYSILTRYISST